MRRGVHHAASECQGMSSSPLFPPRFIVDEAAAPSRKRRPSREAAHV